MKTVISVSLIFLLVGCDTNPTIDAFENIVGTYSIYGAIELNKENNSIRIKDVLVPFFTDSSEFNKNLTVNLIELETGNAISLRDTIVNYEGNFTQNYVIEELIQPSKSYAFSIIDHERDEIISSTFSMPAQSSHSINHEVVPDCEEPIRFTWSNVLENENIIVEAGILYEGAELWKQIEIINTPKFVLGKDEMEMEISFRQILVDFFPPPSRGEGSTNIPLDFWRPTVNCFELDTNIVQIRYTHLSEDWKNLDGKSHTIFELIDSEEIENGIGFLGGFKRSEFSFEIENLY